MTPLTRGGVANCPGSLGPKGWVGHGAKTKQVSGRPGWAGHTDYTTRHWDSPKRSQWVLSPFVGLKYILCWLSTCPVSQERVVSSDSDTDPVNVDGKCHWGKMGLQPSDLFAFLTSASGFLIFDIWPKPWWEASFSLILIVSILYQSSSVYYNVRTSPTRIISHIPNEHIKIANKHIHTQLFYGFIHSVPESVFLKHQ